MTTPYPVEVLSPDDGETAARCFRVLSFLRPYLTEELFLERLRLQSREAYRIAYIAAEGQISAAAGYRVAHFLAWGKVLYIDDLVTHPDQKNKGMGGALLDWLLEQAKAQGCDEVHLDTGFQRHDAHRLYLNKGFKLACHHLSLGLR
jgi:GNAT superfamily N-acetyltransferase